MPYGVMIPLIDDLSQLWEYFYSGFAVVCAVHRYRISGGGQIGDCHAFVPPDLDKVYELPSGDLELRLASLLHCCCCCA